MLITIYHQNALVTRYFETNFTNFKFGMADEFLKSFGNQSKKFSNDRAHVVRGSLLRYIKIYDQTKSRNLMFLNFLDLKCRF